MGHIFFIHSSVDRRTRVLWRCFGKVGEWTPQGDVPTSEFEKWIRILTIHFSRGLEANTNHFDSLSFLRPQDILNLFIYLFIFGCVGSSFLCEGFLQLWRAGATLHRGSQDILQPASVILTHGHVELIWGPSTKWKSAACFPLLYSELAIQKL